MRNLHSCSCLPCSKKYTPSVAQSIPDIRSSHLFMFSGPTIGSGFAPREIRLSMSFCGNSIAIFISVSPSPLPFHWSLKEVTLYSNPFTLTPQVFERMRSGVLVQETSDNNIPKRKSFLISKSLIYQCNPLLLRNDLPSHPPDPVIEVVADDAELPYLRGVANVRSYAGAVIVIAYADDAQGFRRIFRQFAQVH